MKTQTIFYCLFAVIAFGIVALGQTPSPPASRSGQVNAEDPLAILGELNGRTYQNKGLKFKIEAPKELLIANQADFDGLLNRTRRAVSNKAGDQKMGFEQGAAFERAASNSIPLYVVTLKPDGSDGNAALEIIAIRQHGKFTAKAVQDASVKAMVDTGTFRLIRELDGVTLGGKSFTAVEIENRAFSIPFRQRTFFTVRDDFAIAITIAYSSEEQIGQFTPMLETLKFEPPNN